MTAIGRALMARPRLLVLDEPSMGLAPLIVQDHLSRAECGSTARKACRSSSSEQNSAVALSHAAPRRRAGERCHRAVRRRGRTAAARRYQVVLSRAQAAPPRRRSLTNTKEDPNMDIVTTARQTLASACRPFRARRSPPTSSGTMPRRSRSPKRLAARFEKDAAIRDRDRIWPVAELDAFSQSGLWSINVPARLRRSRSFLRHAQPRWSRSSRRPIPRSVRSRRTISASSPRSALSPTRPSRSCCSAKCCSGVRFGNAFSEFGSKRAADFETRFTDAGDHVIVQRPEILFDRCVACASGADRGAR